ncbi:MAG: hypothetical protein JXN59_18375 [Anaerolineae bacterium]|nr:hypothetical protein [Anaerolineae bacterium]
MDSGKLLRRAWEITRQYAWLWIFGLMMTGMGSGNVDITLPLTPNMTGAGAEALSIPTVIGVVFVAGVLAVLGVALWVAGAVARAALIVAADRLAAPETEAEVTLGQAAAAGVTHFGPVFLIGIPAAIPALLLTFLAYAGALAGLGGDPQALNGVMTFLLVLGAVLVLMSLGLTLVQHFADRAAVLEGLHPLAAYRRGWGLLWAARRELRGVMAVWVGLTLGMRLLLAVPTTVLILPVLFAGAAGSPLTPPALTLLCVAGFLSVMVSLLFAITNVFSGVLWTLAYRACTRAGHANDTP